MLCPPVSQGQQRGAWKEEHRGSRGTFWGAEPTTANAAAGRQPPPLRKQPPCVCHGQRPCQSLSGLQGKALGKEQEGAPRGALPRWARREPGPLTNEGALVDADLLQLPPVLREGVQEGHLRGVVGVGAEDHRAVLPVKGEVGDLPTVKRKGVRAAAPPPLWARPPPSTSSAGGCKCLGASDGERKLLGSPQPPPPHRTPLHWLQSLHPPPCPRNIL